MAKTPREARAEFVKAHAPSREEYEREYWASLTDKRDDGGVIPAETLSELEEKAGG